MKHIKFRTNNLQQFMCLPIFISLFLRCEETFSLTFFFFDFINKKRHELNNGNSNKKAKKNKQTHSNNNNFSKYLRFILILV